MKKLLIILSVLLSNTSFAENKDSILVVLKTKDYSYVDSVSKTYKTVNDAISKISLYNNEADKARACFNFVANYMEYSNYKMTENRQFYDTSLKISIKTKSGVCYDYSALYKYMCNEVGLECVLIIGLVKSSIISRHAWNVVTIDRNMYILDVTFSGKLPIDYNSYLIPPKCAISFYYPVTYYQDKIVICYKNDGDFGITDFTDLKGFDAFYIKNRKGIDIFYSRASKYQLIEKPMSIYYYLHTVPKSDNLYIANKTTLIHLRQMPNNCQYFYMKKEF